MIRIRYLLIVAAVLSAVSALPPAAAAKDGQRVDRSFTASPHESPRIAPIPVDALTVEAGMLAVTIDGAAQSLQTLTVTPPGPGPFPLAVISHGSPRDAAKRGGIRLRGYLPIAEDFARRGYKAIVFARRGYAGSTGDYAERAEDCTADGYARAGHVAASDYLAVIAAASADPAVDRNTVVAVGQSAGGFAVSALAGTAPRGLIAAISFAGGRGSTKDFTNCDAEGLTGAFDLFGRDATVPVLWLYSTADRYFWPDLVHRNFEAYSANGAPVRLEMVGPLWYAADGHELLDLGGRALWRPRIDAFLEAVGAPTWSADPGDAAVRRIAAPAGLSKKWHGRWLRYLGSAGHKAFALGPKSRFGWASRHESRGAAVAAALDACQAKGDTCRVVSVDGAAVD
ncbi:MAG: prolyl oligopeptidase family serine peptidase [Thalassobaculum sp.]|uniref:alpha/beta hydrolase family protein n=1 Tax=Thalassobaculum sp. TaxID=2022740 RepID=UPI0032F00593